MEDLDERCQNCEVQDQLIRDLEWLGIDWDGPVVYQTNRLDLYESVFQDLKKRDLLYPCFCSRADLHAASAPHASDGTPIYAGTCRGLRPAEVEEKSKMRPPAWRIEVPDEVVEFDDLACGHVVQNLKDECGDFIVRRSDGVFAYQLACAVDDMEMGVNHVVRGNDLLASTPRQIWLQRVIAGTVPEGFCRAFRDGKSALRQAQETDFPPQGPRQNRLEGPCTQYLHIPLLVNEAGQRLSKRDKSLDLGTMQEMGLTPEDIVGKIAHMLGLADVQKKMSTQELLSRYSTELYPKWSTKQIQC